MSALTRVLFPAPAEVRNTGGIFRWWESRRLTFNIVVGGAGLVTLAAMKVIDRQKHKGLLAELLAHITAVERSYQILTFEERLLSRHENELWGSALKLGVDGRQSLRGYPLEHYLEALSSARTATCSSARTPAR